MKSALFAALTLFCGSALAAGAITPPPAFTGQSDTTARPAAVKPAAPAAQSYADAMRMEPNAEDLRRAREARAKQPPQARVQRFVGRDHTVIETYRDNNNRMTEVVVRPGTTEIPYTMENRSSRPIDMTPGSNPNSTLGTPKFFKHTW